MSSYSRENQIYSEPGQSQKHYQQNQKITQQQQYQQKYHRSEPQLPQKQAQHHQQNPQLPINTHYNSNMAQRPPPELPLKPRSFSHQKKTVLRLRPLSDYKEQCSLLQRRISRRSQHSLFVNSQNNSDNSLTSNTITSTNSIPQQNAKSQLQNEVNLTGVLFNELKTRCESCEHCREYFMENEKMVNLHGMVWHQRCFVCAQCFQPFPEGVFFEFEGRRYCERDFQVLLAPQCHKCKEFIMGRVIKAVGTNWHPDCFKCQLCEKTLADVGFVRNNKRSLCKECHEKEKIRLLGKNVCFNCRTVVEENDYLKFKGEVFHAFHFNCKTCGIELNSIAREKDKELYCLRCYDKLGIPICAACRTPVEEKVVHALGKMWHIEHFVCSQCEKPFFGNRHYEDKGMAYCELHYFQMKGGTCFHCNSVITGNEFKALNKSYCENHFSCFACNKNMDNKSKFMELDGKAICKNCFKKFPSELVKRQKKMASTENKKI